MISTPSFGDVVTSLFVFSLLSNPHKRKMRSLFGELLPASSQRSTMKGKIRKSSTEKSCFDDLASFSVSATIVPFWLFDGEFVSPASNLGFIVVFPLRLFLSATVAFSCESRSPMKGNEDDGETVKALRKGPTRV